MKLLLLHILCPLFMFLGTQQIDFKEILISILEISEQRTPITSEDYHKLVELTHIDQKGFNQYLEDEGIAFDVNMYIIDDIYSEVFYNYKDSTALKHSLDIINWAVDTYPMGTKERKVADSRLAEVYTLKGLYDKALLQAETNLKRCEPATLDYATCLYTTGWIYYQMKNFKNAIETFNVCREEYIKLLNQANEILSSEELDPESLETISGAKLEIEHAIIDINELVEKMNNNSK